jgi:hypothetical protein
LRHVPAILPVVNCRFKIEFDGIDRADLPAQKYDMHFRSLGQIYVDTLKARDWFEATGIPTSNTRLENIVVHIEGLLNPTTTGTEAIGSGVESEDTYYALSDGAGFGQIATEMSKLPPDLLPLAISKEEPASSDPRNKFVELELAANLSSAGLQLLAFDDVKFRFEGHSYLVECKRPSQSNRLEYNVEKAYTQLRAKLNHSSDRGMVAVALEKVFELDSRIQPAALAISPTEFSKSVAEQFRSRISKYQTRWVDPRVVGVLAIIRFLYTARDPDIVGSSYILALIKFTSSQPADDARLDRLIEVLRGRFQNSES